MPIMLLSFDIQAKACVWKWIHVNRSTCMGFKLGSQIRFLDGVITHMGPKLISQSRFLNEVGFEIG